MHGFRMHRTLLPGGSCGNDPFNLKFVRVEEQANERHLIIGLVADVADDDYAWRPGKGVNVSWGERFRGE